MTCPLGVHPHVNIFFLFFWRKAVELFLFLFSFSTPSRFVASHAGKDFHAGGQADGAPEAAAHQGAHPDLSRCVSTLASATIWKVATPPATGPQATAHLLGLAKPAGEAQRRRVVAAGAAGSGLCLCWWRDARWSWAGCRRRSHSGGSRAHTVCWPCTAC